MATFSDEAEQLLSSFKQALEPNQKHVGVQTEHSDIMETLDMLQAQKDMLRHDLANAHQELRKKELQMKNLKLSINNRLQDTEEKVQRLKLRNEAVENLFSLRPSLQSHASSSVSSSRRKTDDSQTTIDKYSSQHKEIMVLRKQLEQREDMEKKIHHLEGRLLSAAKARGKEKFRFQKLEGQRDDARRDMQLAQLAKNNAEQKCQELQRKLTKLEANILTQDANLCKILEENKNLQAQVTGANEVILKEGNFYRNYVDTLKVDFSTIVREHTELKKMMTVIRNNHYLMTRGLIRLRSLMDLPNVSRFREDLVRSTENAKRILLHHAQENLERKYKKNIFQVKQYELMNKDLSRTIHGQKEQIDLLHNEKMEGKVKIEILSKANEAMKTELSNVREQLLSVSSERDSKKKKLDLCNAKLREHGMELSQMSIQTSLMNKLLISERENNEKFRHHIDEELQPRLRKMTADLQRSISETSDLKNTLHERSKALEFATRDLNLAKEENQRLNRRFDSLKKTSLDRIDKMFVEASGVDLD